MSGFIEKVMIFVAMGYLLITAWNMVGTWWRWRRVVKVDGKK